MKNGTRLQTEDGRKLTITGSYEGHGPDDPSGYYYRFDGETIGHWISTAGAVVRFTKGDHHEKHDDCRSADAEDSPSED